MVDMNSDIRPEPIINYKRPSTGRNLAHSDTLNKVTIIKFFTEPIWRTSQLELDFFLRMINMGNHLLLCSYGFASFCFGADPTDGNLACVSEHVSQKACNWRILGRFAEDHVASKAKLP